MKKTAGLLLAVLLLLCPAGCAGQGEDPKAASIRQLAAAQPLPVSETSPSEESYEELEARLNTLDELTGWVNTFAGRLSPAVLESVGENRAWSPLSLYLALSMLSPGARGETAEELTALLGATGEELAESFSLAYAELGNGEEDFQLELANSLWALESQAGQIREDYLKTASERFAADIFAVPDFGGETMGEISRWAGERSGLTGYQSPPAASSTDFLRLVSAIQYRDLWIMPFDEEATKLAPFFLEDGAETSCDTMNGTMDYPFFSYADAGVFEIVALHMTHSILTIYLPAEGISLTEMRESPVFQAACYGYGLSEIQWIPYVKLEVSLPKFDISTFSDLKEPLGNAGLGSLFTGECDLSGIAPQTALSAALQTVRVQAGEKGMRGSGVTEIPATQTGSPIPEKVTVTVDRPFYFTVGVSPSYPLLHAFDGVVYDPAKS